jgi:4-amino-4-deoxy-L-arabinose transferase-like glycosyltransferase
VRGLLLLVLLVFAAGTAMVLPLASRFRGDERFYTNAAIRMIRTGQYLIPRYETGRLRFQKPILTYWALVASYRVFGVRLFSSRLPQWLAGVGCLALTFLIARRLLGDARAAVLAAAIMAMDLDVLKLSVRATPDMLLCAFLSVSLAGFISLAFERRLRALHYACFYVGAGLAVATKGALALVLVAACFGFVAWRGRRLGVRCRDLVHWPSILAGLAVAGFWFAAVAGRHGTGALAIFWGDQVGARLDHESKLHILENIAKYPPAVALQFWPWVLLIVLGLFRTRGPLRRFWARQGEKVRFVALVYLVLLAVFGVADMFRARYFLPCYPLLASLSAGVLVAMSEPGAKARVLLGGACGALMGAVAVLGAVLVVAGAPVHWRLAACGGVVAAVAGLLALDAHRRPVRVRMVWLALSLLVFSLANEVLARPVFVRSPAHGLVARIRRLGGPPYRVAAVGLQPAHVAQMRIYSGGRWRIDWFRAGASAGELAQYPYVVGHTGPDGSPDVPPGRCVVDGGVGSRGWKTRDYRDLYLHVATPREVFARHAVRYWIAVRPASGSGG